MRISTLLIAAAATIAGTGASAQGMRVAPPDYRDQANWLCLPGRGDVCSKPLSTAALNPNSYGKPMLATAAKAPAVDCFYVYPTVSQDQGPNSDLVPGPEEQGVAAVQFARFAGVCRPFAPMYHQVTLAALRASMAGTPTGDMAEAYTDVAAAWRHYLDRHNGGRPFVLVGHSQGSVHLIRLLQNEIEGKPVASRMLSAMLLGFNVEVPRGKLVGGTFKRIPLCSSAGQTGCVISYVSFPAASPPPAVGLFGRSASPGMTVGCTNPAALGSGVSAPLTSYWYTAGNSAAAGPPITWSSRGPPPAPYLRTQGLTSARCVNDGPVGYLSVTVNANPRDARTDVVPGAVHAGGAPVPSWGLHLADVTLAMGDLLEAVEAQAETFARNQRVPSRRTALRPLLYDMTRLGFAASTIVPIVSIVPIVPIVVGIVPEPATWACLILGFGAVGGSMRHARRKPAQLAP